MSNQRVAFWVPLIAIGPIAMKKALEMGGVPPQAAFLFAIAFLGLVMILFLRGLANDE